MTDSIFQLYFPLVFVLPSWFVMSSCDEADLHEHVPLQFLRCFLWRCVRTCMAKLVAYYPFNDSFIPRNLLSFNHCAEKWVVRFEKRNGLQNKMAKTKRVVNQYCFKKNFFFGLSRAKSNTENTDINMQLLADHFQYCAWKTGKNLKTFVRQ